MTRHTKRAVKLFFCRFGRLVLPVPETERSFVKSFHFRDFFMGFSIEQLLATYNAKIACAFNPYSAGIDFSRQNLTFVDVRF